MSVKILQMYYDNVQLPALDPLFTPYDNSANAHPELREWVVWNSEYEAIFRDENPDYLGFLSWKFHQKTNLTGDQVLDHISDNAGADVYLFNPCIANEAIFENSWVQGNLHHPNISSIGNTFVHKMGYPSDYDVASLILDRRNTIFANYVIGNQKFWSGFMEFTRGLFTESEGDAEFKQQVFGAGLSNYAYDKSLPNFTFLIERLLPTYLDASDLVVCPYVYTASTVNEKYLPYFADIMELSNAKMAINDSDDAALYQHWVELRNALFRKYGNILGLE